ncbi:MAG: CTB family bacteriocin [Scytonematopsis contorta HA4267-MV1]|jgi:hypothetical protein|nr:CTB family bacteriocin [Scytonematopsis contorta HA4267-MV1]
MSNEIMNSVAVELSSDELDTVAGGLSITLGDGQGFSSDANNSFRKNNLTTGQQTFAGPNGSGTTSMTNLQEIFSSAAQGIGIKN